MAPQGFQGVRQPLFDDLVRRHGQCDAGLEGLLQQLQGLLAEGALDSSPAAEIRRLLEEGHDDQRMLKDRQRIVHEMEKGGGFAAVGAGLMGAAAGGALYALPEADVGSYLKGIEAARTAKAAAGGDVKARAKLDTLAGELKNNPQFAKMYMHALGAKGLTDTTAQAYVKLLEARRAGEGVVSAQSAYEQLNALNCAALARTTDPHDDAYLGKGFQEELKQHGRLATLPPDGEPYSGYWALGQVMRHADGQTPFSPEFIGNVGRDMIAWDRETQLRDGHTNAAALEPGSRANPDLTIANDPLIGLMNAAATGPAAAQALLADDQGHTWETNDYLLHDRASAWNATDHGDAMGKVYEQATRGNDWQSKSIAEQFTQIRAATIKESMRAHGNDWIVSNPGMVDALSGMRDSTTLILTHHLDDTNWALQPSDEQPSDRVGRFQFRSADLDVLLNDLGRDQRASLALVAAQEAHMQAAIANAPPGDVAEVTQWEARTLGHLVAGTRHGQESIAFQKDLRAEEAQARLDFLIDAVPLPSIAKHAGEAANTVYDAAVRELAKAPFGNIWESGEVTKAQIESAQEHDKIKARIDTNLDRAFEGRTDPNAQQNAKNDGEAYFEEGFNSHDGNVGVAY